MNVCILGTGYVGLVVGACFAEMGNIVWCVDKHYKKIEKLKLGQSPIYEPNLEDILKRNLKSKRLRFTTDVRLAVEDSDVIFIAVGTPTSQDGSSDLSSIFEVAQELGKHINNYKVIVTKSTVPLGTTEEIRRLIGEQLLDMDNTTEFDVASNPEFLKEGSAVEDFITPDRIILGVERDRCLNRMKELYQPWINKGIPFISMDIRTAELTKYAANAMLATRISFMNEIASICDVTGADIEFIKTAMGLDKRIGKHFLSAGIGYGGSCFPKDIRALIHSAELLAVNTPLLQATELVNTTQREKFYYDILNLFGDDLFGYRFAVWGVAFKPETDDIRESPAITTIQLLLSHGAVIHVHDPIAINNTREALGGNNICYFEDPYKTTLNAHALLIFTEWEEYRKVDLDKLKNTLKSHIIFDGRNVLDLHEVVKKGFHYYPIGRGRPSARK